MSDPGRISEHGAVSDLGNISEQAGTRDRGGMDIPPVPESLTLFISAGEASGEQYGTLLIEALKRQLAATGRTARFFGMGGERMAHAGCECVVRSEEVAVMGFTEIVHHLPRIYREFNRLKKALRERKPDVAVLIDFPGFHLRMARELHRLGIPVVYFVSPQLWAWKKHRIHQVRRSVDRMLVIFPFEEAFYRKHGIDAEFVGHPLADLPQPTISRQQFAADNGLDPARTWIGLLPGSRIKEIRTNLPEMLSAASHLHGPYNATHEAAVSSLAQLPPTTPSFLLPLASTLTSAQRTETRQIVQRRAPSLDVHLIDDVRAGLFHSRASIVASGTATIEAALIGNPLVVVYRVSALTYAIAKQIVKVPHIAMVNLIANKRLVPELIQAEFTADGIVKHLEPLLREGDERTSMMRELAEIRGLLRTHLTPLSSANKNQESSSTDPPQEAIERVAAITLSRINRLGN